MPDSSEGQRPSSDRSENRSTQRTDQAPSQRDETLSRPGREPSRHAGHEGSPARVGPESSPRHDPGGRDVSLQRPGGKHEPAHGPADKNEPGGRPGARTEPRPGDQKSDAAKNQAVKADAAKAGEQQRILEIFKSSKSLEDFKLNLGLGPISDQHLGEYLKSKGFDETRAQPSPKGSGNDGPSVGPDRHGEPIVTREILVAGDMGFERVSVTGTAQQIADAQRDANAQAGHKAAEGVADAVSGAGAARTAGADKFRGESSPESGRHW